jgi:hypothetical protein
MLGYDPAAVDEVIAERDSMLSIAERRVRAAEAHVAKLEQQVKAQEDALVELEARRLQVEAEREPSPKVGEPPAEPTAESVGEELSKVVTSAEASTTQIIEAWSATRHQIMQADLLWKAVQEEIVRFAAWREDVEPMMTMVQGYIDQARIQLEEVPQRVEEALAPAAEAMSTVATGMAQFAKASTMPLLPKPLRPSRTDEPGPGYTGDHLLEHTDESTRSFEQVLEEEGLAGATIDPFGFGDEPHAPAMVLPPEPPEPPEPPDPPEPPEGGPEDEARAIETLEASGW